MNKHKMSSDRFHTFLSTTQGHVEPLPSSKLQGRTKSGIMKRGGRDDGFRCSETAGLQIKTGGRGRTGDREMEGMTETVG